MKTTDVLIVGGGPAGSSLAYALRGSGLSVTIMDRQSFPRQKTCAGWVTPAVMQSLNIDLNDYASERVLQKIYGFNVGYLGQKRVHSDFSTGLSGEPFGDQPISYGIRRLEFDDYLLRRCGAELMLAQPFKTMQKTANGYRVNNSIEAKLVVGAGGHFCPVARAIGSKGVSELAVAAQEVEFEMTPQQQAACPVDATVPELFFTPDLMGYGWVFRKGNYLNVGLGREDKSRLSSHVERFCRYLQATKKIPAELPAKFSGHAYLLYPHARREMVKENVLLIGDAAGLAYEQSGEGIRPAVESALIAASVIRRCSTANEAPSENRYSEKNLQAYNVLMQQRFGKRQPPPGLFERLPATLKQFAAGRLMQTQWFTRNIVMNKWFLQNHRPPLSLPFSGV